MNRSLYARIEAGQFERAAEVLQRATAGGQVLAASIYVQDDQGSYQRSFGKATNEHAAFLLGSITKPIVVAALMTLYDEGLVQLNDRIQKYLPDFTDGYFNQVELRHLLTHTSGLPDQVVNNSSLRAKHAGLEEFVANCKTLPFRFVPGTAYEYSSMGILLASEIAQRVSGLSIATLVQKRIFEPLKMLDSALGFGDLDRSQIMPCQVEFGAPEAGGGSPESANWNWNSEYWRALGAPWGGAHASATDVGKFLWSFLHPELSFLKPATASLMVTNHNPSPIESRGLGFDVDLRSSCVSCSSNSFGHTGSTGTIGWADVDRDRVCVVLTTLPGQAVPTAQHPRQLASEAICQSR